MSEKKMVRRSVALALGIACVILIAGLGGEMVFYASMVSDTDNTIARKDNQIASLNTQLSVQNNTVSSLNTRLVMLRDQVRSIHVVGTVNSTVGTENSTVWIDNQTRSIAPDTGMGLPFYAYSAGYVLVLVSSSNNSTYVQVLNQVSNNAIVGYDRKIQVGFDGTAVFPILSGPVFVEVEDLLGEATITVTAIYCY